MTKPISLFCLTNGDSTSKAFPLSISSDSSVGDLKDLIKTKRNPRFSDVAADELTLWRVQVPVLAADKHKPVLLETLSSKEELLPTEDLSEVFRDPPLKHMVHIVIERPLSDLSWTTNSRDATLEDLRHVIGNQYPKQLVASSTIVVLHQEDGASSTPIREKIISDVHLRNVLDLHVRGGAMHLTLDLDFPPKAFSDYRWRDIKTLYGIDASFPPLEDIGHVRISSEEHKKALGRLLNELEDRISCFDPKNEPEASVFVCSFLVQTVKLFPEICLAMEKHLEGRRGRGDVDYAIQTRSDPSHMLNVTEVKYTDISQGLAQNVAQLDSTLVSNEHTIFSIYSHSPALASYGIVTTAKEWCLLEFTIDHPHQSLPIRPSIRCSKLPVAFNYDLDSWRDDAEKIFGHLLWFMQKVVGQIPNRQKRFKASEGETED
ncbi:hypothetical protein BGX34_002669 [Mortierella sp. NVP85]|nr:hypothetical protein BGX34_002669 [Mortierella sp. NVP85]